MSKAFDSGLAIGQAMIEMVRLMPPNQTMITEFYQGLFAALGGEFDRRNITSQCSGWGEAWFCSTCKHDENYGEFCESCGEPRR